MTIDGSNLPADAYVQFGTVRAWTVLQTDTMLVVRIPRVPQAGTVNISVWSENFTSEILAGAFTYTPTSGSQAPDATSTGTPTTQPAGDPTTQPADAPTTQAAAPTTAQTAPTGPTRTSAPAGNTAPAPSTAAPTTPQTAPATNGPTTSVAPPTTAAPTGNSQGWRITSVSPASGSATGGYLVTISGVNLPDGLGILFGSSPATVVLRTSTSITVVAPRVFYVGRVDVTAGFSAETSTLPGAFTYTSAPGVTAPAPTYSAAPTVSNTTVPSVSSSTPPAASSSTAPAASSTAPTAASSTAPAASSTAAGNGGIGGTGRSRNLTLNAAGPNTASMSNWLWDQPTCASTCASTQG
jgi:hypothetical protein